MCLECGVEYFEMSHLFTQWGAHHAPKIMAETENGYERIFGWDTDAAGEEYRGFLSAVLPPLLDELESLGVADRCVFHISDEPGGDKLESYEPKMSHGDSVRDFGHGGSDFYTNSVAKEDRSIMNVPFVTPSKELDDAFVKQAAASGLLTLKGHRLVGGMRASIYNAMPVEGVKALIEFMKKFELENK